ncbi:hypothetical protein LCGC14_0886730, partial [marine sediment metagenome]
IMRETLGGKTVAQEAFPTGEGGQFGFRRRKVDRRRKQPKVPGEQFGGLGNLAAAGHNVIDCRRAASGVQAVVQRKMSLWVEIQEADVHPAGRNGGSEVGDGRRLPNAPFT